MKFRFCNLFVRLGSAPIEKDNFISIERRGSNCFIRVAAFAEQFDAAIAFYMEVSAQMRGASERCWFELQRRRRRLPGEILSGIRRQGYTRHGALYGDIGSYEIRTLINDFWLGDQFRIIGTPRIDASTAVELAMSLDEALNATTHMSPKDGVFVLEKQYHVAEPFLILLVEDRILDSTRELISHAAARLQHPILEVGPGAWPAGQ